MKLARYLILLGALLAPVVITVSAQAAVANPPAAAVEAKTYKTAVIVSNRAGKAYDDKVASLEDYVAAQVTDLGISVISRETATQAVAGLDHAANAADTALAQGTSAVRLAQTLGADYLLQVTLTGFDADARKIDAYGVQAVNVTGTLRVTYKILDGATGASLTADTVKVSKLVQQGEASVAVQADMLDELLAEAAKKVAVSLKARLDAGRIAAPSAAQGLVTVMIQTEVADLTIPDIRIGVENTVSISESKLKVLLSASIEVDGVTVGTAPGEITVKPGLSKLRITREGFKPWERTVNFIKGQKLSVALEMSDEGYARWKDSTAFLNGLKNGAKLTDGEVKVLEGKAKAFEQSGFKVDTKDAPAVTVNNHSLFGL
ncbi:MAG: PEGA domain-containing protein [Verrucomicrobia bacterium]|nr:PEGA domain-containing protein [Verrucomicrobiota bacterium]